MSWRRAHTWLLPLVLVALVGVSCTRRVERSRRDPVGELVSGALEVAEGQERTYHLYVPSQLPDGAVPLLIALHGGLGTGLQFRENSNFDALAESNGFLVVYPDGTRILPRRDNRVWNGGACCGAASAPERNVDDVRFISALIDRIAAEYAVDVTRVYATGHSNGAIMALRLACELSHEIVAVAYQAGTLEIGECEPSRPVSVLSLHGLADTNIPIGGGRGDGPSGHTFASPVAAVELFAELDGCSGERSLSDSANGDVAVRRWTGCDEDVAVELRTVEGANHAWMGHPVSLIQRIATGRAYPDLDASSVLWSFLASQSRS